MTERFCGNCEHEGRWSKCYCCDELMLEWEAIEDPRDAEIARLRTCAREMARVARGWRESCTVAQIRSVIDTVMLRHRTRQRDEQADVIVSLQAALEAKRGEAEIAALTSVLHDLTDLRPCPKCGAWTSPDLDDYFCDECAHRWSP